MTLFKSQVYINKIKLTNIQLVFFVSELSARYAIPYCLNPENISPFTSNSTCHWMIPTEGLLFIEIIGFSKWLRLQRAPLPQLFRSHHRKNSARGQFISVWLLSHVWLFATPWTAAHQSSLSITLPELAQTHVHPVSDAIQPSHLLSSPSPPAFSLSPASGCFPVS